MKTEQEAPLPTFPYQSSKVETGDIVTSRLFAYGHKDSSSLFHAGNSSGALNETMNPDDPRRAKVRYLVVKAKLGGGGSAQGGDQYPDGWQVDARELAEDGSYDPEGDMIRFYQSGCFNCTVKEVTVVGKMRKVVTFVELTPGTAEGHTP